MPQRRMHWALYLWPGLPHLWVQGAWAGLVLAVGFTVLLCVTIAGTLIWPLWLDQNIRIPCFVMLAFVWVASCIQTRREFSRQTTPAADTEHKIVANTEHKHLVETKPKVAAEHLVEIEFDQQTENNSLRSGACEADNSDNRTTEQISQPIAPVEAKQVVKTLADRDDELFKLAADQLFIEAQSYYLLGDWVLAEKKLLQLKKQNRYDVEARLMLATLYRHTNRLEQAAAEILRLERLEAADTWWLEIRREKELMVAQSKRFTQTTVQETIPNASQDTSQNTSQEANSEPVYTVVQRAEIDKKEPPAYTKPSTEVYEEKNTPESTDSDRAA